MWIIIYLIPIAYIVWLFVKSKSDFFTQDREVLADKRQLLILVLMDRGFSETQQSEILNAFDMFKNFPSQFQFDGATILADFQTIKGLDIPAMMHDYRYIKLRNTSFKVYLKGKLKADVQYGKDMRMMGVTWLNAWSRVMLLFLSTFLWMTLIKLRK